MSLQAFSKPIRTSSGGRVPTPASRVFKLLGPLRRPAAIAVIALGGMLASAVAGPTYTLLHSFSSAKGAYPVAAVIHDASGNLYGTTQLGGASNLGVVFELIAPAFTEKVLYSFTGSPGGAQPYGGLIMDASGNLYGTTSAGGASNAGVVFELIAPAYTTEKVLYSFTGGVHGSTPFGGLTHDSLWNLYGTTFKGGASAAGVVFMLAAPAYTTETVLHSFTGGADGAHPIRGVVRDSLGNLYGTTELGGASGYGVVFKLIAALAFKEKVLHSFTGGADGATPVGFPILDSSGELYGTTEYGGNGLGMSGHGVVFKLTPPTYTETVLYTFTGGVDGSYPLGALYRDSQGDLFGTTYSGGSGRGVVFELNVDKVETVLHTFSGPDGQLPYAGLIRDALGVFYGSTELGGASGVGVVFKLTP